MLDDNTLVYIGLHQINAFRFLEQVMTIDTTPKTGQQLAISSDGQYMAVIFLDRTMDMFTTQGELVASFENQEVVFLMFRLVMIVNN